MSRGVCRSCQKKEGIQFMCGIVGFIGCKPAAPLLLEGLAKVEYRGYDSAGLALV